MKQIVSGGQTGVDRAALDAAMEAGVPHGGWCPAGRLAEDGCIAARYLLRETTGADYVERTERNVIDSDATLILHRGELEGGTAMTRDFAARHGRPCLTVDLDRPGEPGTLPAWLSRHHVEVLNVAGPRESKQPGIYRRALDYLRPLCAAWAEQR